MTLILLTWCVFVRSIFLDLTVYVSVKVFWHGVFENMDAIAKLYRGIGEEIKRRRKQAGMSQAELADAIDQLRASVANIEAGRQKAPLHVLYAISDALGTELKAILPDRFE